MEPLIHFSGSILTDNQWISTDSILEWLRIYYEKINELNLYASAKVTAIIGGAMYLFDTLLP